MRDLRSFRLVVRFNLPGLSSFMVGRPRPVGVPTDGSLLVDCLFPIAGVPDLVGGAKVGGLGLVTTGPLS